MLTHRIDTILDTIASEKNVEQAMKKASAAGYVKPFYATTDAETPTATTATPLNTGICIGGLGSAYAKTPAGTTPFLSWCPGVFVTPAESDHLRMANFFYSERGVDSVGIYIYDRDYFMNTVMHYPLLRSDGSWWFDGSEDWDTIHARLAEMVESPTLYDDNREVVAERGIHLTPQTIDAIANGDTRQINFHFILDVYSDSVVRATDYSTALTGNIEDDTLADVANYDSAQMATTELYPFSRKRFTSTDHKVRITQYDWSSIVCENEELSALPLNWSRFKLENPTDEVREVTLLRCQENLTGAHLSKATAGGQDAHFYLQKTPKSLRNKRVPLDAGFGIVLSADKPEMGDMIGAISVGLMGDGNENLWISGTEEYYDIFENYISSEALNTGRLRSKDMRLIHYTGREQMNGALAVTLLLQPGETREVTFTQAVDFPEIEIGSYKSRKKYDEYLISKEYFKRGEELLTRALSEGETIAEEVCSSTEKLLEKFENKFGNEAPAEKHLTEAAINQLSFFASSMVWDVDGKVLLKECAEYPFFNSLDVYFYGSFALFALMPSFDTAILKDFATAILREMPEKQRYHYYRFYPKGPLTDPSGEGPRSIRGAVIHDLGCMFDMEQDSYYWRNPKEWKDLAPKYALMVLRNYHFTGNNTILTETFEAVSESMEYLYKSFDSALDLPLVRNGIGDTFDEIGAYGVTTYTATLWIAGVEAYCKIMELTGQTENLEKYRAIGQSAREDLQEILWDEQSGNYLFYTYPVEHSLLNPLTEDISAKAEELGFTSPLCVETLNSFLYGDEMTPALEALVSENLSFNASKIERIAGKKRLLFEILPELFSEDASTLLLKDADEFFADQLLADNLCALLGLPPVTPKSEQVRILKRALECNKDSIAGIRNVGADHKNEIFSQEQGQEVWVGVQYSLASAFLQNGKREQALVITESLYENLYEKIRIPFAAPEAIIQWGYIEKSDLQELFDSEEKVEKIDALLRGELSFINDAGRMISLFDETKVEQITTACAKILTGSECDELVRFIESNQVNYTVGHYLRPGMIFSLLFMPEA